MIKKELSERAEREILKLQEQVEFSWNYTYENYRNNFDSFTFDISRSGTSINDIVSLLIPGEDLVFLINCEYEVEPDYDTFTTEDRITDYQESIYWNSDTIIRCFSNMGSIKESMLLQQNGDNDLLGVTPYTVKYPTELTKFCSMLCDLRISHYVKTNGVTIQVSLNDDFDHYVQYYFDMEGHKKVY